jgi:DeoR family ulaG and ulaABCDEF operon transcriptional repressor
VVCGLEDIDLIITDDRIDGRTATMIESAGVRLLVAPA